MNTLWQDKQHLPASRLVYRVQATSPLTGVTHTQSGASIIHTQNYAKPTCVSHTLIPVPYTQIQCHTPVIQPSPNSPAYEYWRLWRDIETQAIRGRSTLWFA